MAGGDGAGYVEGKGGMIKDLFAEAKLSCRPIFKRALIPHQGPLILWWAVHFPRTPTDSPCPGAEVPAWSVVKLKAMDGAGQPNPFSK